VRKKLLYALLQKVRKKLLYTFNRRMSLNLKGMTRENAVDESINHFQQILNSYSEASKISFHEFGIIPGIITSEKRKREANFFEKIVNCSIIYTQK
jgi:hypothetical protein